jgi:hypothetical protein
VTPEEMELSRLGVENLLLKREYEILKNRPSGKGTLGDDVARI